MPTIDVYAAADLFPAGSDRALAAELTAAVLRAEGVATPGPFHTSNTAAYIHRMDPKTVHAGATDGARTVGAQIIAPGVESRRPEAARPGGHRDRHEGLRRPRTGVPDRRPGRGSS